MSDSEKTGGAGKPRSYVVMVGIWALAMVLVVGLGAPQWGPVGWLAIGVVAAAMAWPLWRLGVRLHAFGGAPAAWHAVRALCFWLIGLMNTVWAVPGAEGTWKWWGGVVVLGVAAADSVAVYRKERRALREAAPT